MAGSTVFPAIIRPQYDPSGGFPKLVEDAQRSTDQVKRIFERDFAEIGKVIQQSVSKGLSSTGALNLDVSGFKTAAAQASAYRLSLEETQRAAQKLAKQTGDTSVATTKYIQALSAQVNEARQAEQVANAQVTTYSRLQAEIDASAMSVGRLATAYRDLELARNAEAIAGAKAEVRNRQFTAFDQSRGVGAGVSSSARNSARAFEEMFAAEEKAALATATLKREADLASQKLQELWTEGNRIVESGRLIDAIYRNTAEAFGHASKSAADSASVFQQAFAKQEAAAERAAQATRAVGAAAEAMARDAAALRGQLDPMFSAQQRFDQEMLRADKLLKAGAISQREYAAATALARDNIRKANEALFQSADAAKVGTTANHMVVNSQRAARTASIQLGQQMQDVAISLYGGQRASVVFAQQLPQLAFALSGVGGKVGAFATMLSGPWSIALVAASAALGMLVEKYILTGNEADKGKTKQYDFARGLDVVALSAKEATNAMQQLGDAVRSTIKEQGELITSNAQIANQSVDALEKRLNALREFQNSIKTGKAPSVGTREVITGLYGNKVSGDQLATDITSTQASLAQARAARATSQLAVEQRAAQEAIKPGSTDIRRINEQIGELNRLRQDALDLENSGDALWRSRTSKNYINEIDYQKKLAGLLKQRKTIEDSQRETSASDGVSRFKSRQQAIGVAGRELIGSGLRVSENAQFGGVKSNHPGMGNAAHGLYAIDVNAGAGITEANVPDLRGKFDAMARRYQERGYRVLWNGQVYEAGGSGPSGPITKGSKHTDHMHIEAPGSIVGKPTQNGTERGADRIDDQLARMAEYGRDVSDRIGKMRQHFEDTPAAVRAANDAMATLNDLADDIGRKVQDGLDPEVAEELKRQIEELKPAAQALADGPFRDMVKATNERKVIEEAILAGNAIEAQVVQRRLELEKNNKTLTADRLAELRSIVIEEHKRSVELEKQAEVQNRQLQLLSQTKSNITGLFYDLFKGGGVGAIGNAFAKQWDAVLQNLSESLTESLFGDFFRSEKDKILGFDKVNEASTTASTNIGALGDAASQAAQVLANIQAPGAGLSSAVSVAGTNGIASSTPLAQAFDAFFGKAANDNTASLVQVQNVNELASSLNVFTKPLTNTIGTKIEGAVGSVFGALGIKTRAQAQTLLQGAAYGSVGGGLIGKNNLGANIGGMLGQQFSGQIFGKGLSKALGAFAGPLGGILGGVVGGLLGSVFSKAKTGSASVSNGNVSVGGNNVDAQTSVSGVAGEVNKTVSRIAEALGGSVGSYGFTIGQRNDEFRVSGNTGADVTGKNPKDSNVLYKGKDASEAMRVALVNAIQDGAVKGIREGAARLLKAGKDLETQLDKALKFNAVFDELDSIKDPTGHAVRKLNKQFEELISIFKEAGATTEEWGQLQELYDLKRTEVLKQQVDAAKQAADAIKATLTDLINSLEVGDSGLSLRSRLSNAREIYDPLAAAIRNGETVDYDKFSQAAKDVIDITRQIYGSQKEYFDTFNDVLGLSKQALAKDGTSTTTVDTSTLPGSPNFSVAANDNSSLVSALDKLGFKLVGDLGIKLDAVNTNLGLLIQQGLANGTIVPDYNMAAGAYF